MCVLGVFIVGSELVVGMVWGGECGGGDGQIWGCVVLGVVVYCVIVVCLMCVRCVYCGE